MVFVISRLSESLFRANFVFTAAGGSRSDGFTPSKVKESVKLRVMSLPSCRLPSGKEGAGPHSQEWPWHRGFGTLTDPGEPVPLGWPSSNEYTRLDLSRQAAYSFLPIVFARHWRLGSLSWLRAPSRGRTWR